MAKPKKIDIALQGGGAHGAFAWGVLDFLLEDGRLDFAGITAASAGAMNATVMAYGLSKEGPALARNLLETFWREISDLGAHTSFSNPFLEPFMDANGIRDWLSYMAMGSVVSAVSPYQFNPLNINPLKDVIEDVVDFEHLRNCTKTRIYIGATNVRNGKVRIFRTPEITSDVVMASACLPQLYQAVEIDGEHYWDGGFSGNPPLWPLFYDHATQDVLVVHLNPIERDEVPKTAADIQNRVNEISFNASLLKEMRAVAFVQRLVSNDMLKDEYKKAYSNILFHSIRADKILDHLSIATKYKTDWAFLKSLFQSGRETAEEWLAENHQAVGKKSTVDLHQEFLDY